LIPKETIDVIFETARVEEVVGDFVLLKKRGANLLGLCPFHNEKTPSFTVSPAKGIYKCFGCGASGNAVNFVMELEHFSYPEALKYLAKKYNIEVPETEIQDESYKEHQSEKESLFVLNTFAENHFVEQLNQTDEGKNIGLSYFIERGFTKDTIQKFKLGYSLDDYESFTKKALKQGFLPKTLLDSGLSKEKDGKTYDGYRGRVIFPIHNLSGRPIGFGGRTLKADKKVPKYINSPQNAVYDKSKVLYGLFFAKRSIIQNDNCYLVEGYTDVISLHQTGIENVVSSSGTSLTTEQIQLISRYTKNITILFDGDMAGIKASFRGIDMILSEGLSVKVVLFPDNEDPDSYARKHSSTEVINFINHNAKDFIVFKTGILFDETNHDPVKKVALIHEIVDSISLIPDQISRSVYIKECSKLLDIEESTLVNELNKSIRKKSREINRKFGGGDEAEVIPIETFKPKQEELPVDYGKDHIERDVVRLILNYPYHLIQLEVENEVVEVPVSQYIVEILKRDELMLENESYQSIIDEFIQAFENELILSNEHFTQHQNPLVQKIAIDLFSEKHELHEWSGRDIIVENEENKLVRAVTGTMNSLLVVNIKKIKKMHLEKLKNANLSEEETREIMQQLILLDNLKTQISKQQGRIIN
jgi:DNA primase